MTKRLPKSSKSVAVLPTDYAPLLAEIKARIRTAQVKAALAANAELVLLYWQMGQRIAEMQAKEGWGAGVIPRLAADLHAEFPEMNGFSERNIGRMIRFFQEYPDLFPILPPAVAKLSKDELVPQPAALLPAAARPSTQDSIVPTASAQLRPPEFSALRSKTAVNRPQRVRSNVHEIGRVHGDVNIGLRVNMPIHAAAAVTGFHNEAKVKAPRRRDHMLAVKQRFGRSLAQQSFSPRNLKYMRAFAEAWPETIIVQQPVAQLTKPQESEPVIVHQPVAQLGEQRKSEPAIVQAPRTGPALDSNPAPNRHFCRRIESRKSSLLMFMIMALFTQP